MVRNNIHREILLCSMATWAIIATIRFCAASRYIVSSGILSPSFFSCFLVSMISSTTVLKSATSWGIGFFKSLSVALSALSSRASRIGLCSGFSVCDSSPGYRIHFHRFHASLGHSFSPCFGLCLSIPISSFDFWFRQTQYIKGGKGGAICFFALFGFRAGRLHPACSPSRGAARRSRFTPKSRTRRKGNER